MDNHPIPQDVTGFQFRLIGSMTVKQFAYVGVGAILAVIVFYLPINFLFKLVLIPLFGGTGALLAFVPIEGRPMDVMASNFLKALFTPNQYLYHKIGGSLSFNTVTLAKPPVVDQSRPQPVTQKPAENKESQLTSYLSHLQSGKENSSLDQKESAYLQHLFSAQTPVQSMPAQPPTAPPPSSEPATAPVGTMSPQSSVAQPLPTPAPQITPVTSSIQPAAVPPSPLAQVPVVNYAPDPETTQTPQAGTQDTGFNSAHAIQAPSTPTPQPAPENKKDSRLEQILAEKKRLEEELARLTGDQKKDEAEAPGLQSLAPQLKITPPATLAKTKDPISSLLPEIPNVLMGTIKDSRGNALPGVLVEVRDGDGNPVRAFKTNLLGQFASATALLNGTYTVAFEDPKAQHKFSDVTISVDGNVLPPVEIFSIDAREELRKSLFA